MGSSTGYTRAIKDTQAINWVPRQQTLFLATTSWGAKARDLSKTPNLDITLPSNHPLAAKLLKFHIIHCDDQPIVSPTLFAISERILASYIFYSAHCMKSNPITAHADQSRRGQPRKARSSSSDVRAAMPLAAMNGKCSMVSQLDDAIGESPPKLRTHFIG